MRDLRRRLRSFIFHQGIAWRRLFGIVRRIKGATPVDVLHPPPDPAHPLEKFCRCANGRPARSPYDEHDPACGWLPFRCRTCEGSGWCSTCGGDGIRHLPKLGVVSVPKDPGTVIPIGSLVVIGDDGKARSAFAPAHLSLAGFLKRVISSSKHGPLGEGGPGPCDADCLKCEAERCLAEVHR